MEGQGDVAVLPPEGAGLEYPVDAGGGEFPGEGDEYASHGGDEVCCPARPARTPHSLALSLVGLAVPDFRRTARRRPPPRLPSRGRRLLAHPPPPPSLRTGAIAQGRGGGGAAWRLGLPQVRRVQLRVPRRVVLPLQGAQARRAGRPARAQRRPRSQRRNERCGSSSRDAPR